MKLNNLNFNKQILHKKLTKERYFTRYCLKLLNFLLRIRIRTSKSDPDPDPNKRGLDQQHWVRGLSALTLRRETV